MRCGFLCEHGIIWDCIIMYQKLPLSYVVLQEVEHAPFGQLSALVELLHRLPDLLVWDLPLTILLIVKV